MQYSGIQKNENIEKAKFIFLMTVIKKKHHHNLFLKKRIDMYTLNIKYLNDITFISTVKLSNLKHFLKMGKYKKPYTSLEKYIIKYALHTAFNSQKNNKNVMHFRLEK